MTILNLLLCFNGLAQTSKNQCLPSFEVKQSEKKFSPHIVQFEIVAPPTNEKNRLKYLWKVTGAEIIDGQGSEKIIVLAETADKSEVSLKVEVDVKNAGNTCQQKITTEYYACILSPESSLIEAYNTPEKEKESLGELKQLLENDPLAAATIVLKDESGLPERLQELKSVLDKAGLPKSRITIAITDQASFKTEIWKNPFSIELDEYKNAVFIKYEHIDKIREILKPD